MSGGGARKRGVYTIGFAPDALHDMLIGRYAIRAALDGVALPATPLVYKVLPGPAAASAEHALIPSWLSPSSSLHSSMGSSLWPSEGRRARAPSRSQQ